jgi:hypothetical protein
MVRDTNISTLADASGKFDLRGVSAGPIRLLIVQPGSELLETNFNLNASMTNLAFTLRPDANLVRNGDFKTHWIATNAPDCWTKMNSAWEGEVLALRAGQRYRVRADFRRDGDAEVIVRWSSEQPFVVPKPTKVPPFKSRRLTAKEPEFTITGSTNAALMLLTIRTTGHPTNELRRMSVTPTAD